MPTSPKVDDLEYANAELRRIMSVCNETVSIAALVHALCLHDICQCQFCAIVRRGKMETFVIDNILSVVEECSHLEPRDPVEFLVWEIDVALLNHTDTPQKYSKQTHTIDAQLIHENVGCIQKLFPPFFQYTPLIEIVTLYIGGDTFISLVKCETDGARANDSDDDNALSQIALVDHRCNLLRPLSAVFSAEVGPFQTIVLREDSGKIRHAISVHPNGLWKWVVAENCQDMVFERQYEFPLKSCNGEVVTQSHGSLWNYSQNRGVLHWKTALFVVNEHHLTLIPRAAKTHKKQEEEEEEEEMMVETTHLTINCVSLNGVVEQSYSIVLSGEEGVLTTEHGHVDLENWDIHVAPSTWLSLTEVFDDDDICFALLNRKDKCMHFFHPTLQHPKRVLYLKGCCSRVGNSGEVRVEFHSSGEWFMAWTVPPTNERPFGYRESDLCVFMVNLDGKLMSQTTSFPKGDWIDAVVVTNKLVFVDVWAGMFIRHGHGNILEGRLEVPSDSDESADHSHGHSLNAELETERILSEKIRRWLASSLESSNQLRWFCSISWRFTFRIPSLEFVAVFPIRKSITQTRSSYRLGPPANVQDIM